MNNTELFEKIADDINSISNIDMEYKNELLNLLTQMKEANNSKNV